MDSIVSFSIYIVRQLRVNLKSKFDSVPKKKPNTYISTSIASKKFNDQIHGLHSLFITEEKFSHDFAIEGHLLSRQD